MPVDSNLFSFYRDLIEEVLIQFKAKQIKCSKERFYTILFLCKFYELISDINVLIEGNRYNSIPVIFRAALEVSIDLKNISRTDRYLNRLCYSAAKKEFKRLSCLSKNDEYELDQNHKELLAVYEGVVSGLPDGDKKELTVFEKFNKIDESELLYRIVYSKLCKETHSDMIELEKHFVRKIGNKISFKYDVGTTDLDKEDFVSSIKVTILETLVAAGEVCKLDTSKYENMLSARQGAIST